MSKLTLSRWSKWATHAARLIGLAFLIVYALQNGAIAYILYGDDAKIGACLDRGGEWVSELETCNEPL